MELDQVLGRFAAGSPCEADLHAMGPTLPLAGLRASRTALDRVCRLGGPTMGTTWSALVVAPPNHDLKFTATRIQAALDAVDCEMSGWQPDSALSQLNAAPVGEWIPVSPALAHVIKAGLAVGSSFGGAFDVTVGAAVARWGFGPRAGQNDKLSRKASALGYQAEPPAVLKRVPLEIDLSGIAKGFGVDEATRVLKAEGLSDWLVSIDGEVRAQGGRPGQLGGWTLSVEAPVEGRREAWDVIRIGDRPEARAVATSGDYRHVRRSEGRCWSHTIDPRTGRPLEHSIASVTVLAADCMMADAIATALLVLGPVAGVAAAQARGIAALFLCRTPDGSVRETATGNFDVARM